MSRIFLTVAAVAATLAFAPRATEAAMPVSGALQAGAGSDIVLAQTPPAASPGRDRDARCGAAGQEEARNSLSRQEAEVVERKAARCRSATWERAEGIPPPDSVLEVRRGIARLYKAHAGHPAITHIPSN